MVAHRGQHVREVAVAAVLVRRGAAVAAGPLVEELHVVRRVRRPAPRRVVARHAARSSPDQQREEVCEPPPAWTRAALSLQPDIRIPSIATIIVVPTALINHWASQIKKFVNFPMVQGDISDGSGRGVVYLDGLGGDMSGWTPGAPFHLNDQFDCSDEELSSYLIIVTTFQRLRSIKTSRSPLLDIRFLRLVVDEGHHLFRPHAARARE